VVCDSFGKATIFPETSGEITKGFYHYYEENEKGEKQHHLKRLCMEMMPDGKPCGLTSGDMKADPVNHHCRLLSIKNKDEDEFFSSTSSTPLSFNYTHYAAVFFVNNTIPLSAANVYLTDFLQKVCNVAYVAGKSGAAKPVFTLYPGKIKTAILELDDEFMKRHPTVQAGSIVSVDTDSSTVHHLNFHISALHPVKSRNCVPFVFNIFLNVHTLLEYLKMKESLLRELHRLKLVGGILTIDGQPVQDAGFRKRITSGNSSDSDDNIKNDETIRSKCLCHVINLCIAAWILTCPRIAWMIEMLRLINPILACTSFRNLFLSGPPGIVPTRWYFLQNELVHILQCEDQLRIITETYDIPFLSLCRSLLVIIEPVVALMKALEVFFFFFLLVFSSTSFFFLSFY
jgi:hypothetical protein